MTETKSFTGTSVNFAAAAMALAGTSFLGRRGRSRSVAKETPAHLVTLIAESREWAVADAAHRRHVKRQKNLRLLAAGKGAK